MTTPIAPQALRRAEYGSDVIVDVLRALEIEFVALNPGATFRGLHDSLVNYGGNMAPEMILCPHEEVAAAIAHGYGKAAGKPMAAAVHDIAGLLHAGTAIFNAWLDRASMIVLGGTGPMAVESRRPWIDWIHTALVQGNAVRDFVKWDDQPASVASSVESLIRAYQIASSEPKGPVYICFDAAIQEQRLDSPIALPDLSRYTAPSRPQADPRALERAADLLLRAERPVVVVDYLGKDAAAVEGLVRLSEALSLPVVDLGDYFNFPSRHPLNATEAAAEVFAEADLVLALDVYDLQQAVTTVDYATRQAKLRIPEEALIIDISLRQYAVRSWVNDFGRLHPVDLRITADTALAVPALADLCARLLADWPARAPELRERQARLEAQHQSLEAQHRDRAARAASETPVAFPFLAQQVWEAVRGHDWVLTDNDLNGWARRLWDITQPYQYHDSRGGLGNGLGRSLGVVLANRGKGRLCVDFQADGDLLYTATGLWTAAHHQIPLLVVMYNNRSYYNDEVHQGEVARYRGRPVENRVVGIRIENPEVDFAGLARSLGVHGEGPVLEPEELAPALRRAVEVVAEQGRPALVDVVTQNR